MLLHFEQPKLVYFSLMAVVFSTTGVTLRTTLFSIGISLAALYWFARGAAPEVFSQYFWIGVATAFAAFGMATLLRKAILKQIDARLLADELAAKAQISGRHRHLDRRAEPARRVPPSRPSGRHPTIVLDGHFRSRWVQGHQRRLRPCSGRQTPLCDRRAGPPNGIPRDRPLGGSAATNSSLSCRARNQAPKWRGLATRRSRRSARPTKSI